MKPLKSLRHSGGGLSIRTIRFSEWNVILLFAVCVIMADLRFVELGERVLIFDSMTVESVGYGIGVFIFVFLPSSRVLSVGRFGACLALVTLVLQVLLPGSLLEFYTLYSFAGGMCMGYAFYMFFFFMNNAERLLNLIIVQLYFAIIVYGLWGNTEVRMILSNVVVYILCAFFIISLFTTKKSLVPKKTSPKPGGCGSEEGCCSIGRSGMWVLFFVFIIFVAIDSINTFIVHKDASVDHSAYSIGVIIAIIVAVAVRLLSGRSLLYMWRFFLIGSLLSMALLAVDGIFDLRFGSLIYGIAHSLGYISVFFLIGGSANMTGCLKMFKWFCLIVFLMSLVMDPVIEYVFARFNEENNLIALILMIVITCIMYSRYSFLYKKIFESDWIEDLSHLRHKKSETIPEEEQKKKDITEGLELTPREKQIFVFMLTDMSVKQIMIELEISKGTFNFHTANLYRKLEIQSRTELLVKFGA